MEIIINSKLIKKAHKMLWDEVVQMKNVYG